MWEMPGGDGLGGDTVWLTATRRLARALRAGYAGVRQEEGLECWDAPDIVPWSEWLNAQAQDVLARARVLTADEEHLLWEDALGGEDGTDSLLCRKRAAREAREAWNLACAYCAPVVDLSWETEETERWLLWLRRYRRQVDGAGWVDAARLPDRLAAELTPEVVAGRALVFCGFDECTPQMLAFQERWCALGGRVKQPMPIPSRPESLSRFALADVRQEALAVARWAHARLAHEPGASIGVIVPGFGARRAELWRSFSEVFHPESCLPPFPVPATRSFNFSLGEPLAVQPRVVAALDMLSLLRGGLPPLVWARLVCSPYLGGAVTERDARARLDPELRRRREDHLGLDRFCRLAARPPCAAGELVRRVTALKDLGRTLPRVQSPSTWLDTFDAALITLGWPGDAATDSLEFQVHEAWRQVGARFARLATIRSRMDLDEALSLLTDLSQDAIFQPESADAAVQVMGPLEAGGLVFDHLAFIGLTEDAWPPAPEASPFLPIAWQIDHDLPRASARRERAYAERLTRRLCASARRSVALMHPECEGERTLAPSPLIQAVPPASPEDIRALLADECVPAQPEMEEFEDGDVPLDAAPHGGAGFLKAQSACPFQAFARYRLGARPGEPEAEGLDDSERGRLVHRALECFWGEVKDADTLAKLDEVALAAVAGRAAEQALRSLDGEIPALRDAGRLANLERDRLAALVEEIARIERKRTPFKVEEREFDLTARLGELELKLRADRIDRLPDGALCVIDYKTGSVVGPRQWDGERPEDPQLPAYALALQAVGHPVAALTFLQVRAGDGGCRFLGMAERGDVAPGVEVAEDWVGRTTGWRAALDALAEEIARGRAEVAPRSGSRSPCRTCGLDVLCRVHETAPVSGDAEEDLGL